MVGFSRGLAKEGVCRIRAGPVGFLYWVVGLISKVEFYSVFWHK